MHKLIHILLTPESFKDFFFERSYHNLSFIMFKQKNHLGWGVLLVQAQQFGTGTKNDLEILHQCSKRVKTKSQKVLGANSYICSREKGKTHKGGFFGPVHP